MARPRSDKPTGYTSEKIATGVQKRTTNTGIEYWMNLGIRGEERFQALIAEAERLGCKPAQVARIALYEYLDKKLVKK